MESGMPTPPIHHVRHDEPHHVDADSVFQYHDARDDDMAIGSVVVDLSFASRAPVPNAPHLTCITVPLPSDLGFRFTPEEGAVIDALVAGVVAEPSAFKRLLGEAPNRTLLVARATRRSQCDMYFYSERPLTKKRLVALERAAPGWSFQVRDMPDAEWSFYLTKLHPGVRLEPLLLSKALVERRRLAGDRLEEPRDVEHVLAFRSAAARDAFLAEMDPDWRSRVFEADDPGERRFMLGFTSSQPVTEMDMSIIVAGLSSAAAQHDGKYDGWGAVVLRE
jgi:hypothetical protein